MVSLNGEAGSGKTTLKNFIRHFIAAGATAAQPAAMMVELNPALWSDRPSLPGAFFAEVGAQLAGPAGSGPFILGEHWRQLGAALAGESRTAISERYEALSSHLRSLAGPLIIFVDDFDRLPPPQVRQLLRVLTTHAAMPNVICFLLGEKRTLVAALGDGTPEAGAEILRRTVHLELEVPEAPESLLRRELERGLADLLSPVDFPARPRERWNEVLAGAVWPLFSTPRDVKRFLAAFAFQLEGHFRRQDGVLEVNPIDLVLLEALRMFAHPVYLELRDTFRRRETRLVRLESGRDEERKEARVEIDCVVHESSLPARRKRVLTLVLQHLLPPGTGGGQGCREDWDRDLRLCSPRHVERYFHLGASHDAVPAYRLIELVRATGERSRLEQLLLQAGSEHVLPEVLDRLPALLDALGEKQLAATAAALCGICDQLPPDAPSDVAGRLVRLATDLFARLKNPMKREDIVAALLDDSNCLTGPILLLQNLRPRAESPVVAGGTALSIEQFRRLVKPAVEKLRESALAGNIWRSREYGALIRRWWDWSDKGAVRPWLLEQIRQPEPARAWLRTFLESATSSSPRERVLQLEEIAQYCDPAVLAASALKASGDDVDRAAVRALSQALAPQGTTPAIPLRTLLVKLEGEAA